MRSISCVPWLRFLPTIPTCQFREPKSVLWVCVCVCDRVKMQDSQLKISLTIIDIQGPENDYRTNESFATIEWFIEFLTSNNCWKWSKLNLFNLHFLCGYFLKLNSLPIEFRYENFILSYSHTEIANMNSCRGWYFHVRDVERSAY